VLEICEIIIESARSRTTRPSRGQRTEVGGQAKGEEESGKRKKNNAENA